MKTKLFTLLLLVWTSSGLMSRVADDPMSSHHHAKDVVQQEDVAKNKLQASAVMGFESNYVTSGAQAAYESFQPGLELGYCGFYAGLWVNLPVDTQSGNPNGPFHAEYDFYAGYRHGFLDDQLQASLGGTFYYYPETGSEPQHTYELNLSLGWNVLFNPTVEYNYDFELSQSEVLLVLSHSLDLSSCGVEGLSLEVAVAVGYLHADDIPTAAGKISDGYAYCEVCLDLTYTYNENFSLYAGPRIATNNNGVSNLAERETNVWWGMGAAFEF